MHQLANLFVTFACITPPSVDHLPIEVAPKFLSKSEIFEQEFKGPLIRLERLKGLWANGIVNW